MRRYRRKRRFMFGRDNRKRVMIKRIRIMAIMGVLLFVGISFANGGMINKFIQYVSQISSQKVAQIHVTESGGVETSLQDVEKKNFENKNHKPVKEELLSGSSLLEIEFDKEDTNLPEIQKIKSDIENYLSEYNGLYGVYYFDLENKQHFGVNHTQEYTAASTVKVPLNIYLCKEITNGNVDPNNELTYLAEDYEGGTGKLRYKEFGSNYKIKELSDLSISYSDNVATNMLIRYLGRQNFKDYMSECGGKIVRYDDNVSSPVDMARYLKIVYDLNLSENTSGVSLMNSLLNTKFNTRIPMGLPEDVKVAHKIGSQVGVINDVGIIFTDKSYILCVMSNGVKESEADEIIGNISKQIYEFNINTKISDIE